ncbi:MAG: LysR family transcriptional regulator [Verrucomicrobia bacterium]|nr:LysR family transcriptional regulator [Verrucomicrobiota bacterium]
MELRQLRYFVGVAREQSFTRAAAKLRVAQPALSRQIRQLEDEVGVVLLERGARGVRLTEAGEVFLADAAALLEQSAQAVRRTRMSGQHQQRQLNVGYVWGLFHTLVPPWVARFRQRNPEVAVNLFDLTATQQAEMLGRGKLDLGFIGFALEADAARLAKRKVGQCAFMAALPAHHPAAGKRKVALTTLAQDFFIVISEQTYPGAARFLKEACRKAGFRPKILQTAERGYTILGLVAGNCGVTLLPESLQALPHPGVVFRPLLDAPQGDLFVAWNPASESPAARTFVASLSL